MKITKRDLIMLIEAVINEEGTEDPKGEAPKRRKRKIKKRPARGVTRQIPAGFLENPEERARFAKGYSREAEIFPPDPKLVRDYAGRYAGSKIDKSNPTSHISFGPEPDDYTKRGKRPYRLENVPEDPKEKDAYFTAQSFNIGGGERSAQDPEPTMLNLPDEAPEYVPRALEAEERNRYINWFLDEFMEEKGYSDDDTIPMDEFRNYVQSKGYYFPMKTLQKEVKRILNDKKLWKF